MTGRYGVDELYVALVWLLLGLMIINTFIRSLILSACGTALTVIIIIRFLSRNIPARMRENNAYLRLRNPIKNWLNWQKDRLRDIKTARYRKCPGCRAIIKLPNKKGKHTTSCPRCGRRFDVHIIL